jgi:sulfate permease, SulP family
MIIAQSAAASRVYGIKHHERVDENADLLGPAVANAVAALSGAFVVNGSPTHRCDRRRRASGPDRTASASAAVRAGWHRLTIAIGMIDVKGLADIRRESHGESLPSRPRDCRGRSGIRR